MEFHQAVQNRAIRTAAVIRQFLPTPSVGNVTVESLFGLSQTLDELAQRRDDALADFDAAGNAENQGFVALRALTLQKAAQASLEDGIDAARPALLQIGARMPLRKPCPFRQASRKPAGSLAPAASRGQASQTQQGKRKGAGDWYRVLVETDRSEDDATGTACRSRQDTAVARIKHRFPDQAEARQVKGVPLRLARSAELRGREITQEVAGTEFVERNTKGIEIPATIAGAQRQGGNPAGEAQRNIIRAAKTVIDARPIGAGVDQGTRLPGKGHATERGTLNALAFSQAQGAEIDHRCRGVGRSKNHCAKQGAHSKFFHHYPQE